MATPRTTVQLGPAQVDLAGVRGGDLNEFQITLTRRGQPIDLTDYTVMAQARGTATDAEWIDAVVTKTDAVNGVVMVRWPGSDVTDWMNGSTSRTGVWDLQIDDGTNDPTTLVAGTFACEMDVTRGS